jgi:heat shock protein HslJ
MKRVALFLVTGFLMLACNQTEDKEIGEYQPVDNTATRADTTTATATTPTATTTSVPTADTAQKSVAPVPNETLQNFWVLESADGKQLDPKNFPNGTPYFELNTKKNKISGHAGCNGINGSIKVEGNNIVIGKLISTKATCAAQDFENSYLKGLSDHTIPYRIEGTKLYLTLETNRMFVYRKIQ